MTQDLFPVWNVTDWWPAEDPDDIGAREKIWLEDPWAEGVEWLFKAIRCKTLHNGEEQCFGEDWAEKLATEAAGMLGVPAVQIELAERGMQRGVASRLMLVQSDGTRVADNLVLGNELLQAVDPLYDKSQRGEAVGYTLAAVRRALQGIGAPPGSPEPLKDAFDLFAGYLVLDALVASTDRHHENWGALTQGDSQWLAPTFDHGTCLGFQNSSAKAEAILDDPGQVDVETWVSRGKSNHFEGRPKLVALADEALNAVRPDVAAYWLARVQSFDLDEWRDTLGRVPDHRMSHPARRFAHEVVRLNRERLLHARAD